MLSDYQQPAEPLLSILGVNSASIQVTATCLGTLTLEKKIDEKLKIDQEEVQTSCLGTSILEKKRDEKLDIDQDEVNFDEVIDEVLALVREMESYFNDDSVNDNITEQDSQHPNEQATKIVAVDLSRGHQAD